MTTKKQLNPVIILDHIDAEASYIAHLCGITPTSANVMEYADIVKRDSQNRQIEDLGEFS